MRDSRPYRTPEFKAFRAYLRQNLVLCHEDGCYRRATIPDHQPPLSTFPDFALWHGRLLPQCAYHSVRQRGLVAHGKVKPLPSRSW
jgi:hypothetical protein